MTPNKAKVIVRAFLQSKGLSFDKLTAKTVDFTDLGRDRVIFVKVWGWSPNPLASELSQVARDNGFRVEFEGGF